MRPKSVLERRHRAGPWSARAGSSPGGKSSCKSALGSIDRPAARLRPGAQGLAADAAAPAILGAWAQPKGRDRKGRKSVLRAAQPPHPAPAQFPVQAATARPAILDTGVRFVPKDTARTNRAIEIAFLSPAPAFATPRRGAPRHYRSVRQRQIFPLPQWPISHLPPAP